MNYRSLFGLHILLFVCVSLLSGKALQSGGSSENSRGDDPNHPDEPARITLPTGTTVSIRIADEINSNHNHSGDLLTGIVDPSVLVDDHVVIPRGTEANVRLVTNRKGGRLHGKAAVTLELIALVMNEERLGVEADQHTKEQGALSSKLKSTGTAGASSGASAATSATPEGGVVGPIIAVFRAAKVEMPAGTRIAFKLTNPFTFEGPAAGATTQNSPPQPQ